MCEDTKKLTKKFETFIKKQETFIKKQETKDKEASEKRQVYRVKQDKMFIMVKETHVTVHGNGNEDKGLRGDVTSLNLAMYGDKKNKICGIIELLDYKVELKSMRFIRKKIGWIIGITVGTWLAFKIRMMGGK